MKPAYRASLAAGVSAVVVSMVSCTAAGNAPTAPTVTPPSMATRTASTTETPLAVVNTPATTASAADRSAWYWQNPLPHPYSMQAIACSSVTACVAVGEHGRIATTADGGQHWIDRISGTAVDLAGITCPGRAVCYAMSGGIRPHALLRTVDRGATWRQASPHLPLGPREDLEGLVCASARTCLMLAYENGEHTLRTADGGKTWQAVPGSGPITCPTTTTCYRGVDHHGVYGFTHTVVRSNDAGATWRPWVRIPEDPMASLSAIVCPAADTCYALLSVSSDEEYSLAAWSDIVLTRNGGQTWERAKHVTQPLGSLVCPSPITCYALGFRAVIRTINGGASWSSRELPVFNPSQEVSCPHPAVCYAAVGFTALRTTDAFDHTQQVPDRSSISAVFLSSIRCPSSITCYATGDGIAATTNGGATWTDKPVPPIPLGLSCPSSALCYGLGYQPDSDAAVLYRSGNGAESWKRLHLPVRKLEIPPAMSAAADITCVNVTTCYVAGISVTPNFVRTFALLVTHDGGATWTLNAVPKVAPARGNMGQLSCPDTRTCFVAMIGTVSSGKRALMVLATRDGGQSWTSSTAGPCQLVCEYTSILACPTASTCYVAPSTQGPSARSRGIVFVTHDAGTTWHRDVAGPRGLLTDIACANAQTCRVVGPSGVFGTGDGGLTWRIQAMAGGRVSPALLKGIDCPSVTSCFAVGDDAAILGTRSAGGAAHRHTRTR